MAKGISPWREAARRLQAIVSCRATPVGAAELQRRIASIELGYKVRLPPSYKEFLALYDGWPRVFRGASLLATAQLLDPAIVYKADTALAQQLLNGAASGQAPGQQRACELVPIGLDDNATIVVAIDPTTERLDGEMDVVVWISGLGMRLESFAELLEWLADLLEASQSAASQACAA